MKTVTMNNRTILRTGIICHLIIIAGLCTYIIISAGQDQKTAGIIYLVTSTILAVISFIFFFLKTGYWKITHTHPDKLDEREARDVLYSTRISYSFYTVITIIFFYFFSLTGLKFPVILAACFLYFAHILPAAILGWRLIRF